MTKKTGFIYSPFYLEHDTGHHPENSRRLSVIIDELTKQKLIDKLISIKPFKATEQHLALIHDPDYAKEIWKKCVQKVRNIDMDTVVCDESYNVALTAVGGVLKAVDEIANGEIDNAFCAVRPPGHHAEVAKGMGFCLFNNVALGARYAQTKYDYTNVLIIDWDAHHGNGSQHIFEEDPTVFYFSIHQFPHFPGTGSEKETGIGQGKGFTLNIPVANTISKKEYLKLFNDNLKKIADNFKPDIIFISAGFDNHKDDLLANLPVEEDTVIEMTKTVKKIADEYCDGRIISVLEGGYNLRVLGKTVYSHVKTLLED